MRRCDLPVRVPEVRSGTLVGTKPGWLAGRCFYSFSVSPDETVACSSSKVRQGSAQGGNGGPCCDALEVSGTKLFYFVCPRKPSRLLLGLEF